MNIKIPFFASLIFLFSFPAFSENNGFKTYGWGFKSCGWWIEERQKNEIGEYAARNWINGFISGAAYAKFTHSEKLQESDMDAFAAYVDKYCKDNPLDLLINAVTELVKELEK